MFASIRERFRSLNPAVEFCSLRYLETVADELAVRQDQVQPLRRRQERGAMLTVVHRGGAGYAATSDCSAAGLRTALERAQAWADASRGHYLFDPSAISLPRPQGRHQGPRGEPQPGHAELLELLRAEASACRIDPRIVDWGAQLRLQHSRQLYLTADGADAEQHFHYVLPTLYATAHHRGETQTRSIGLHGAQGGLEVLRELGPLGAGHRVAADALELLTAPDCPSGTADLLLKPAQMILQVHESIGHPLELDRILGDERNFAGSSFVSLPMFGAYQYGSPLLNVTQDPSLPQEYASYRWDDHGSEARKSYLIRNGILERPIAGALSRARAGLEPDGVAAARACDWNRPAIDRMANLNLEPGDSSLREMIAAVDFGVMMDGNHSWSIDDRRNKFQFGCEKGWLIENGQLRHVVKNPGYRGVSATFWRSLAMVGDRDTYAVLGSPDCGKGEPNQIIHVGHAMPACLFRGVEMFGGEG